MQVCSPVQSCKLVHVSGIHCHVHASSTSGCAFFFFSLLYSTVESTHKKESTAVQYLYFKLDLQEDDFIELLAVQHEKLTREDLMELEAQGNIKERQEEDVTEELKRFITQEMAGGFSLFEEALLVLRHRT